MAATAECALRQLRQLATSGDEQWDKIGAAFQEYPFAVAQVLAETPTETTYVATLDAKMLRQFANVYEKTEYYQSVKQCNRVDLLESAPFGDQTAQVVVGRDGTPKSITVFAGEQQRLYIVPEYQSPPSVSIPADTRDFSEITKLLGDSLSLPDIMRQ